MIYRAQNVDRDALFLSWGSFFTIGLRVFHDYEDVNSISALDTVWNVSVTLLFKGRTKTFRRGMAYLNSGLML